MSLDVSLTVPEALPVDPTPQIWIREGGQQKTITRAEWDARHPGHAPVALTPPAETHTVYTANITHNLNVMAGAAGLYEALWRPDEHGLSTARQLIKPLRDGLRRLEAHPIEYEAMNPANGWGSYEVLVAFVTDYLAACERWPDATVEVSR